MLGAAGALCCLAAGTALGGWMRLRRLTRLGMLRSLLDMISAMRMLLETERMPLPELLEACAAYAGKGEGALIIQDRFCTAAQKLRQEPLDGLHAAYAFACSQHRNTWEQAEEKAALDHLFVQLGNGTPSMREQAAASCIRRLKPLFEKAQSEAEKSGRLWVQLGMLLGLMAGIVLW